MKTTGLLLSFLMLLAGCGSEAEQTAPEDSPPLLRVGHVGHDHQIALYIAALEGESFIQNYGTGLRPVRKNEVYDLVDGGKTLARLRLVKVGGGSRMPAALSRGEIDVGLGGVPAVVNLMDSQASRDVRIICPLQTDGDMLVLAQDAPANNWGEFVAAAREREEPFTIGYKAPMAVALLIFQSALDAEGITWTTREAGDAQVVLLNMRGGSNAIPLLSGGSIDGFVMNQPIVAVAESRRLGKTVAHLRDLPPDGKWHHHPCCCVCATGEAIAQHGDALTALLKTIHLGNRFIFERPDAAAELAAEWTKQPLEVERASIPTITYGTVPTDAWRAGLRTWLEMMTERGLFQGRLADMSAEQIAEEVCDFEYCWRAAEQLPEDAPMIETE